MTFGWGFLIGILATISVIAVGVIIAAVVVQLRNQRKLADAQAQQMKRKTASGHQWPEAPREPPLG